VRLRLSLVAVGLLLVLPGVASSAAACAASDQLRIVVWPRGTASARRIAWTLRCNPAAGTLPQAARACRRLASLDRPFAPVAAGVACSQIYAGPQVALVTGRFGGSRISARFRRTDSCQTERWNRLAFLFPGA
jgi:Subtilisin inhibitor-like